MKMPRTLWAKEKSPAESTGLWFPKDRTTMRYDERMQYVRWDIAYWLYHELVELSKRVGEENNPAIKRVLIEFERTHVQRGVEK